MALSSRQQLSFNHTASLYSPSRTYEADNKPSAESYALAYEGVRCRFERKQSVSIASILGRVEGDIAETIDLCHLAEDQEIDENWWLLDQSTLPDGTDAEGKGRWFVVRGQPTVFARSVRRQGGKKVVRLSQERNPPLGLP